MTLPRMKLEWLLGPSPRPTPAEFAKARLLEVVAADREAVSEFAWVKQTQRDPFAACFGRNVRERRKKWSQRFMRPIPVYRWERVR
jgi:hypothetical protein